MKNLLTTLFVVLTLGLSAQSVTAIALQNQSDIAPFVLVPLAYAYNALEPNIDAQTMEVHHSKHLAGYVNNLNAAVKDTDAEEMSLQEIMKNTKKFDMKIRNNAGGVWNHDFFFASLSPTGGGQPIGKLAEAINTTFGSFDEMKKQMNAAGATRFGSGWAWLYVDQDGKLAICSTPNQDNPLMDIAENKGTPILGIDVWEHAYYLKYQNKRGDYLTAIWNVIAWNELENRYSAAKK